MSDVTYTPEPADVMYVVTATYEKESWVLCVCRTAESANSLVSNFRHQADIQGQWKLEFFSTMAPVINEGSQTIQRVYRAIKIKSDA